MTLDEVKINQNAVITKVGGEGALRGRLLDMGLIPKTVVSVIKFAPMGDPIEIRLRGYELTIRKDDAAMIEVSLL
ncbi:MAG: FeoA family protein [Eubacteriales bacterium]|nr:ferrous iron transport protein A [Christensenellaceae bacterium]MDY2751316.1 FeoA family protein [Eubacteriales bacterium]MCI7583312.1 ferrous iron transport protein A [Christensenellaceae bacterium]MCI7769232.1 ferrous iron transport protein A [Christensenellaceae bacterium]MDD6361283.1 FeoA family protein [Christensenellaceae bacterium]